MSIRVWKHGFASTICMNSSLAFRALASTHLLWIQHEHSVLSRSQFVSRPQLWHYVLSPMCVTHRIINADADELPVPEDKHGLMDQFDADDLEIVIPNPATHSLWTSLKVTETVFSLQSGQRWCQNKFFIGLS